MKTFLLAIFSFGIASIQNNLQAQESEKLNSALHSYFNVKDALVHDSAELAAVHAENFITSLHEASDTDLSESNMNALLADATLIASSKDIEKQRAAFLHLSENMIKLVKSKDVSNDAIYIQYCPMKKASWLSNENPVFNPYYGSAMLNCGTVKETIE